MAEGEQRAPQLLGWLSGASVSRRFMRHTTGLFFLAVGPGSQGGVKWPWGRWATEAIQNPIKTFNTC